MNDQWKEKEMCKKQMTDRALKLQDKEIREIIFEKIRQNGRAFQGLLPQTKGQSDGKYGLNKGGNWTDGFYVGIFNLAYAITSSSCTIS